MRFRFGLITAASLGVLSSMLYLGLAQQADGGFVPGAVRAPIDPAVVARGKTLYGINCQGCHGPDLRGGDMGGPSLLRSQVALTDRDGENIVPIIQGARQAMGMPKIPLSIDDSKTVAAYVRSVIATIGRAGVPPGETAQPSILAGNATAGQAYFELKCKSCHSPEGDLQGIATRVSNPKALQNLWVAGHPIGAPRSTTDLATVNVTIAPGKEVQGQLLHIDDFLVTLRLPDGTSRSFRRKGDQPRVVVHDPLQAHKDLLAVLTDKNIHDVTAYLVTLK